MQIIIKYYLIIVFILMAIIMSSFCIPPPPELQQVTTIEDSINKLEAKHLMKFERIPVIALPKDFRFKDKEADLFEIYYIFNHFISSCLLSYYNTSLTGTEYNQYMNNFYTNEVYLNKIKDCSGVFKVLKIVRPNYFTIYELKTINFNTILFFLNKNYPIIFNSSINYKVKINDLEELGTSIVSIIGYNNFSLDNINNCNVVYLGFKGEKYEINLNDLIKNTLNVFVPTDKFHADLLSGLFNKYNLSYNIVSDF